MIRTKNCVLDASCVTNERFAEEGPDLAAGAAFVAGVVFVVRVVIVVGVVFGAAFFGGGFGAALRPAFEDVPLLMF